ncbi:MAG TPA: hypothetical protein VN285_05970 [Candidatus Deferrimicrobium sp.]|nr:hypothetical protein [Candidatus Deferrimicrobium sp.]
MTDPSETKKCVGCGRSLALRGGVWVCRSCNSDDVDTSTIFIQDSPGEGYLFIECPGATLYTPDGGTVAAGVNWLDDNDPSKGYEIVKHPVFAPTHTKKRRIRKEAYGRIRRCQACQDYTVRMRRKEGPDFFIPSSRYPGRTKLKSATYSTRASR